MYRLCFNKDTNWCRFPFELFLIRILVRINLIMSETTNFESDYKSLKIRNYLDSTVMPLILEGLAQINELKFKFLVDLKIPLNT